MNMAPPHLFIQSCFFFSTFSVLLFFIFTTIVVADDDNADYMSRLLKSLTPTPSGWSNNAHFCKWNGVVCHQSGQVSAIRLPSSSLSGTLPSNFNILWNLTHLDLHNNSLNGPLPDLAGLFHLQTVYLDHNNFTSIPGGCFHALDALQILNLGNNLNLTPWTFPTNFVHSSLLHTLQLEATNIIGLLPQSLTTLSQLQLLDVSNNNLSGQLPNFPSKVKLITTGNAFLGNISGEKEKGPASGPSPISGDTPSGNPSKTSHAPPLRPFWIAGASVFSVGVAILIAIICKRKRYIGLVQKRIFKKTRTLLDNNVEDFIKSYNLSVPKRYSYAEMKRITNSFRDKLGQGGYGDVYKASLPDGRQVAVKVIKEAKGNGEEFINEVASISRTSHVNIVSLLGFCYDVNKRALIYEFMSNGSLDKFIYRSGFPNAICDLDWKTLFQIEIGIARGLEYLHQGCISRILHLDIKPQNILLDEDFCPKISDFGLAKICQKKESIVSIPGTRGTIGYMAPEVFSRAFGGVSYKSDVYSYGMLILELIGGRKNYDTGGSYTTEMYFPDWIYKDLEQSNNLANCLSISEEENDMVRKITMVSLWCIQTNPLDRPSMSKVIEMLQGPLESLPYPPKPVLYAPQRPSLQISCVSSSNLLETSSMTLQKNGSIKSNDFNNDKNESVIVL